MVQRRSFFSVLLTILLTISFFATGSVRAGELSQGNPPADPNSASVDNSPYTPPEISSGEAAHLKAVVVSPDWQGCSSTNLIWDHLNSNWSDYGSMPISIVYNIPALCSGTITYEALVASEADVLILTDLSDQGPLTLDEIEAIGRYAREGHNLIGTFVLFQYVEDNRALAPLFGLRSDLNYTITPITADFNMVYPTSTLFRNITNPYQSVGPTSQVPTDVTWDAADLNGAIFMAKTADSKAAITLYSTPDYQAIYFSHMPEWGGSLVDEQFFYNAITYRKTVMAAVVKSWGDCGSGSLVWDDLNANWASYGSTPILIDYSNPLLCGGVTVTLDNLRASGADVVILSDPSGGSNQFSPDEAAALQQYALEGHNLLGTYLLLSWTTYDNRVLAPLFGLKPGIDYFSGMMPSLQYSLFEPGHRLFTNLPDPYTSEGFNYSQIPPDGAWDTVDLDGATMIAATSNHDAAILINQHPFYTSIYITNMPEYGGGVQDKQFIYNALIYLNYVYATFLPLVGSDFSLP